MAFGKVTESKEYVKRFYIGVAPCNVLGICPTKEELAKIFNIEIEKDPVYITPEDKATGKPMQVRVDFIVRTNEEHSFGIVTTQHVSLFVNKSYQKSKSGKYKVIDKYGRTAWATEEEIKSHTTMLTKNDGTKYQASLDKDYRPMYAGEEELILFIKNFLGIPDVQKYNRETKTWFLIDNPDDAICELKMDALFKGDFKEVKSIVKLGANNMIRLMFGVKTTDENRQYQAVCTKVTNKFGNKNYTAMQDEIDRLKNANITNIEYSTDAIREYSNKPTDFSDSFATPPVLSDPFAGTDNNDSMGFVAPEFNPSEDVNPFDE